MKENYQVVKFFNGHPITFLLKNSQGWVNTSEMSVVNPSKGMGDFSKRKLIWEHCYALSNINRHDYNHVADFQRFISGRVLNTTNLANEFPDLIKVVRGGTGKQGTWMKRDLAIEYAAYLDIRLKLFINDIFLKLISGELGVVKQSVPTTFAQALRLAAEQAEIIEVMQPKAEYTDKVLTSVNTYKTTHIAKELGMSAYRLNQKLKDLKVIYKRSGVWVLYANHQNKDYTTTETFHFEKRNGETGSNMQTVWTEKGRKFIHSIINESNV